MENKTDSAVDNKTEGFVVEEGIKRPVSKIDAIHILWDIAKKYEIALKHKKVVPIDVAERDRKQINELARKLIDINEKVIDARVLYDLVKMQRFRDKTIILEFMTHKDVLKRIANIVKRRGTPIVSLTGYSVKGASGLNKTSVLDIIEKKKDRQGFEEEELQSIKDLIELKETNFTLSPGERRSTKFLVRVSEPGEYKGSIKIRFSPTDNSSSVTMLSTILEIFAKKNETYVPENSFSETSKKSTSMLLIIPTLLIVIVGFLVFKKFRS